MIENICTVVLALPLIIAFAVWWERRRERPRRVVDDGSVRSPVIRVQAEALRRRWAAMDELDAVVREARLNHARCADIPAAEARYEAQLRDIAAWEANAMRAAKRRWWVGEIVDEAVTSCAEVLVVGGVVLLALLAAAYVVSSIFPY